MLWAGRPVWPAGDESTGLPCEGPCTTGRLFTSIALPPSLPLSPLLPCRSICYSGTLCFSLLDSLPPSGPSKCSGLLPLEDRVGHTPAVARALRSVTQLHRAERYHLGGEGSGPEDKEAPTMQQRATSADPGSAARPPRPRIPSGTALLPPPTGLAPIRTSVSPEQPSLQQQLASSAAGAAAAAGRSARGSRAQRTGAQPAAASPTTAAAVGGASRGSRAARTGAPPAAPAGHSGAGGSEAGAAAAAAGGLLRFEQDGGQEGEEGADVEVVCLSQAWNVFESLMRQVPATQVRGMNGLDG